MDTPDRKVLVGLLGIHRHFRAEENRRQGWGQARGPLQICYHFHLGRCHHLCRWPQYSPVLRYPAGILSACSALPMQGTIPMKSWHVGTGVPSGDKKLGYPRVVMADKSLGYLGGHMLPAWKLNSGYHLLCILEGTQTSLWESGGLPSQTHARTAAIAVCVGGFCEQSYLTKAKPSKGS